MQKVSFELNGEFVELNQLLKLVGLCDSGGAGKQIVASGDVKVDGKQELRKTAKIRAGRIYLNGASPDRSVPFGGPHHRLDH